ncbi:MAG: GNAT family N-acetyltransferase [Candidatus Magasanikbacteria bacterium]|nr:GNAT family N-acetyltransferase [Candidatus Magasanikbacteria bacterium]
MNTFLDQQKKEKQAGRCSSHQSSRKCIREGKRLCLFKLSKDFFSPQYLSWLNDKEVQRYTRRRNKTSSEQDLLDFLRYAEETKDLHMAIILKDSEKHIGNISLNAIDEENRSAECSIMIGDKSEWGKGYAGEAIDLATAVCFDDLGLHRIWAESPNPSFNAIMPKLGWTQEGEKREAIHIEEGFFDFACWSLLETEWREKQGAE